MSKIRITKNQLRELIKEMIICEEAGFDHSWATDSGGGQIGSVETGEFKKGIERVVIKTTTPQPDCLTCADEEEEDKDLLTEPDEEPGKNKERKNPTGGVDERDFKVGKHSWSVGRGTEYPYKSTTFDQLSNKN